MQRIAFNVLVAVLALVVPLGAATAQRAEQAPRQVEGTKAEAARPPASATPAPSTARLPADSRTSHTLNLPGRTLRFTATVGALPITNGSGRVLAEIAYVAYTLDNGDTRTRPVTFAFNGGPGSASTWLHLGGLGPWRLPLTPEMARPSAVPALLPNAETWLDFTDLVFIDPVGTGYSAIVPDPQSSGAPAGARGGAGSRDEGGPRWFYSVGGDVESLSDFMQSWLKRSDRLAAPKMIAGESYGGFRAPRIAHFLQRQRGVGINAMVLISPVLDFESRRAGHTPLYYVKLLPSIGAAALERKGQPVSRPALSAVESYARGELLLDLMRGPRDATAVDNVVRRIADISGLPLEAVRRHGGRLSGAAYMREAYGSERRVASLYDVSMTGFDPYPTTPGSRFDDPFTTGLAAPMTSAMIELYAKLGWRVDRSYSMLSSETNRAWIWGNSPSAPEAISSMKEALSLDPRLRVLVTHGFTDLVTPYFASALQLDQIPDYGEAGRVSLIVYPGGHMHYSRDASRVALRQDAEKLLSDATRTPGQ